MQATPDRDDNRLKMFYYALAKVRYLTLFFKLYFFFSLCYILSLQSPLELPQKCGHLVIWSFGHFAVFKEKEKWKQKEVHNKHIFNLLSSLESVAKGAEASS